MKKAISLFQMTALIILCANLQKSTGQNVGASWIVPPVMDIDGKFEISPRDDDSRFIVQKKERWGVCDKSGKSVLPIEYSNVTLRTCGWIEAIKDGKKMLFNAKIERMDLPYDKFVSFNNNMAVVYKNNLCGLINQDGEELVPVQFEQYKQNGKVYTFTKGTDERRYDIPPAFVTKNVRRAEDAEARSVVAGHYFIKKSTYECGLLNLKRDTVVPPIYRFGAIHQSGYLVASFDGKTFGVIDTRHRTLYPFTAERIGTWTKSGLLPVRFEKKWALLRFPSGEVVFPFGEYECIEVYDPNKDLFLVTQNRLKGLINLKREVILPCAYTYISQYDHVTTELADEQSKHGFLYRPSGYLQAPAYKGVRNLNDSLVIVYTDSTYALVDAKNGKFIIPFSDYQLERTGNYFNSHKPIDWRGRTSYGNHIHGLYDRKGNLVIPHDTADIIEVIGENDFWICYQYADSSKVWERQTLDGKIIQTIPKLGADIKKAGYYLSYELYGNGIKAARKISYVDSQGKEMYYDFINDLKENLHRVKLGKFWGCVDIEGKVVIDPVFEVLETSKDGYIKVKYQGKWGVLQNPKFDYFEQLENRIKK